MLMYYRREQYYVKLICGNIYIQKLVPKAKGSMHAFMYFIRNALDFRDNAK